MSVPNPFSTSNAPQHNLVSKITGGGTAAYNVAVDLVDIDTGYFRQIGSPNAFLDTLYVKNLVASGVSGSNVLPGLGIEVSYEPTGTVVSADLVAGYGVDLQTNGNAIEINSKLAIRAGFGITFRTVTQDDNTNPEFPYGFTEIIATGGTGSTGGPAIIGTVGGVVFIKDGGIPGTDADNLFYETTNPANPVLYVPTTTVQTAGQDGIINLLTGGYGDSTIESGFENINGSGNYLNIQAVSATLPTVTVDTSYSLVGINNPAPDYALDVNGQAAINYSATAGGGTSITFADVAQMASGAYTAVTTGIYRLSAWGGGGAGNQGIGGGGGYGEGDVSLNSGDTIYWKGLGGGSNGGGNAMVVSLNADYSSPLAIIPGGGAGQITSGGVFGGYGGPGGAGSGRPVPEGGYAGSSQAASATYTDVQPWQFGNVGGTFAFASTSSNTGYPDGLTGNIRAGTTMSFANTNFGIQTQFGVGSTYTVFPNNTVTFETQGISFTGGNFIIPDGQTIQVSLVSGLTFESTGTIGITGAGTIVYPNWSNLTGITVSDPASVDMPGNFQVAGDVRMEPGGLFSFTVPAAGPPLTLFFNGTGSINDTPFDTVFEITSGVVMQSSVELGPYMIGNTFSGGGTGSIPPGSILRVGERVFINQGALASGPVGAAYGGGGAVGGGAPALAVGPGITYSSTNTPAGGGGGSFGGSLTYTQRPGNNDNAYRNRLYPIGTGVGDGGVSGASGGSEWLILQQKIDTGVIPPALTVNGTEVVNGSLSVTGTVTIGANTLIATQETGSTGGVTGHRTIIEQNTPYAVNELANSILIRPTSGPPQGIQITHQTGMTYTNNCLVGIDGDLQLAGKITAVGTITGFDVIASSDVRTKNSIVTVDSALDKVMKMRGVFFERNTEPGERRVGVIAQEVEQVLPEVVHTDKDGMKSVSYGSIIGLLIEAIKELSSK